MMTNRGVRWLVSGVVLLAAVATTQAIRHRRPFDPDAVAASETRMWRAYYTHDDRAVGIELISMLRDQFGLSLQQAMEIGVPLATAASKFSASRDDYDRTVPPDLERAYALLKTATNRSYDPAEAAKAELSWWVDRRSTDRNSPEEVGRDIEQLYTVIYGSDRPEFAEAGVLRARAAQLRDSGGDWSVVEDLLRESYRKLAQAG